MIKGRNAAKAFKDTASARFAAQRAAREEQRAAEIEAGTRRELVVVPVTEVRQDDEVTLAAGGFSLAAETAHEQWAVSDGHTVVRRFRQTHEEDQ